MANPNLLGITSVIGKTNPFALVTPSTEILTNPANSGLVYKINSLFISNINGTSSADVSVEFYRGGISYKIASTVNVLADNSLIVIGKETAIYLEEGDAIKCNASVDGYLTGIISYEIIG